MQIPHSHSIGASIGTAELEPPALGGFVGLSVVLLVLKVAVEERELKMGVDLN